MRKIDRLRHEALQSCNNRGHNMKPFTYCYHSFTPSSGYSECMACGAWVQIIVRPAPNGIDIGGPAVALNCGDKS